MGHRRLTPGQTVGPFLSIGLTWEDGPVADPAGTRVHGLLLDGEGAPVADGMVEAWCPEPAAFARCLTDDDGAWHVVMPPAPWYALTVFARGLLHRVVTRVEVEGGAAEQRFDIRLQETAFFDV